MNFSALLNYLCQHQALDYALYRKCLLLVPDTAHWTPPPPNSFHAARNHARLKLGKLAINSYFGLPDRIESAIIRLAQAEDVEPPTDTERQAWVDQLRQFPPKTLERLLPVAFHGRRLLCEALGWESALPLIEQLIKSAGLRPNEQGRIISTDASNSPDPTSGVIDVAAVQNAIRQAGEPLAQKVLRLFDEAKVGVSNMVTLFEAVGGWNRAQVEKGFRKHNQIAIKAYGLLPLERGQAEVVER